MCVCVPVCAHAHAQHVGGWVVSAMWMVMGFVCIGRVFLKGRLPGSLTCCVTFSQPLSLSEPCSLACEARRGLLKQ